MGAFICEWKRVDYVSPSGYEITTLDQWPHLKTMYKCLPNGRDRMWIGIILGSFHGRGEPHA